MHVLIITPHIVLPPAKYGGLHRMAWSLAKGLCRLGHKVTFLCKEGSESTFADIKVYDPMKPIMAQIPEGVDVLHFNIPLPANEVVDRPYVETIHGNFNKVLSPNSIFVSRDHAERFGSDQYVYNGLDWDDYTPVDWTVKRSGYHFLGKAAWKVKNVAGAISVAKGLPKVCGKLHVLGGTRFNFKMGWRFTFSPRIQFHGMVGGVTKDELLNQSNGMIFPVCWHEPFGLAVIESLYYGAPVFATPYGALPEIVTEEVGYLTNSKTEMIRAISEMSFDAKRCHEYVRDTFNAEMMAKGYLEKYEKVIAGETLNKTLPSQQPQREAIWQP